MGYVGWPVHLKIDLFSSYMHINPSERRYLLSKVSQNNYLLHICDSKNSLTVKILKT